MDKPTREERPVEGRSSTPDVDTLVEDVRAGLRELEDREGDEEIKLSDLAARARASELLMEEGDMLLRNVRRWEKRAEAAEADRDRLREELAEMTLQRGTWQERAVRDARRVTELEAALAGFVEFCETLAAEEGSPIFALYEQGRAALAGDGGDRG
jgi:predicted  nucleic acid-binding Zn-ribbon protein